MAEPKKQSGKKTNKAKTAPPSEEQSKPNRTGKPINFWMEEDIYDAILKFWDTQPVVPSMTATIHRALRDFLKSQGHWPPPTEGS
jgi:hypothetical protein